MDLGLASTRFGYKREIAQRAAVIFVLAAAFPTFLARAAEPAPAAALAQAEQGDFFPKPMARLAAPAKREKKISALTLKTTDLRARRTVEGDAYKIEVILEGRYLREGWSLVRGSVAIPSSKAGDFKHPVQVQGPTTSIELMAIGPRGEIETQKLTLLFDNWETARKRAEQPLKPFFISGSIGPSYILYKDERIPDYTTLSVTGKLSFVKPLFSRRWDVGASGYLTLFPITQSADATVRFLGLNFRVGYVVPSVSEPWRLSVMGGLYYTTMFVSTNQFGFRHMAGPQLFPVLRRTFKNGDFGTAYLKFSPVAADFSLLSFANHERATGVTWGKPLGSGRSFTLSLDLATLQLEIDGVSITSTSYSLSAGYGF